MQQQSDGNADRKTGYLNDCLGLNFLTVLLIMSLIDLLCHYDMT